MPYGGAGLLLGASGAWVYVRFVEALEQDLHRVSLVPLANFDSNIAPYSSCAVHDIFRSPDQARHCEVRRLKTGASFLSVCFTGCRLRGEFCLYVGQTKVESLECSEYQ